MRKHLLSLTMMTMAAIGSAATFSSGIGAGNVVSTIPGDYASLKDAGDDFTNYTGTIAGDWMIHIAANLVEPVNVRFANNIPPGRTVTIKPAANTTPVITFTQDTRNGTSGVIWDGHLVIGPRELTGANGNADTNFADTDGFTIDGSNTVGGTTRDLTLTNATALSGTDIPRYMVHVIGRSDNVHVKNAVIDNTTTGSGANICVQYSARRNSSSIDMVPNGGLVENCTLKAVASGDIGRGVRCINIGGVGAGVALADVVVRKNNFNVSQAAVEFALNKGGEISGNFIRIEPMASTGGNRPFGIAHVSSNGSTGWTMNILRNRFTKIKTMTNVGILYAIGFGGGGTGANGITNIQNNIIAGFEYPVPQSTPGSWLYRGLSLENGTNQGTFNIDHNSLHMEDQPNGPQATSATDDAGNRLSAISFLNANGFAGTVNFRNNIVKFNQKGGSVISGPVASTHNIDLATLNFSNNTYSYAGQFITFAKFPRATPAPVSAATLADWQAVGEDAGSNEADPTAPASGGQWVSATDLHFTAQPAATFLATPLAGVTSDYNGEARNATSTAKGADEYYVNSGIADWMMF